MSHFFIPYTGASPAAVSIKGHRFVILSREKFPFEDSLDLIGADSVRELEGGTSRDEEGFLDELAKKIDAGIVVAPSDVDLSDVIENLETELPWLH